MENTPIKNTMPRKDDEIDESEYAFEIKEDGQIIKDTMTNEKIPEE